MERFHRPVRLPIEAFEAFVGADDPAAVNRVAHDTARALLHRVRESDDPEIVDRTINYANKHGIDDLVQLWAPASAHSLPGSLWRLYLLHLAVSQQSEAAAYIYRRGVESDISINSIVAGAVEPTGPNEIRTLIDVILRGAFTGDFADALDRAAAFCAVMSMGSVASAESDAVLAPERAEAFTFRSARYLEFAKDLAASAQLWRRGELE